jgi:hypothetical protein
MTEFKKTFAWYGIAIIKRRPAADRAAKSGYAAAPSSLSHLSPGTSFQGVIWLMDEWPDFAWNIEVKTPSMFGNRQENITELVRKANKSQERTRPLASTRLAA